MLRLDLRKLLDIVAFEKARPLLLETWGFGDAGGLVLGSGGLNRWSTYINTNPHITIYCVFVKFRLFFKKIYNTIIQYRFTGPFGSLFPRLTPHILLSCFLGFRISFFSLSLSLNSLEAMAATTARPPARTARRGPSSPWRSSGERRAPAKAQQLRHWALNLDGCRSSRWPYRG